MKWYSRSSASPIPTVLRSMKIRRKPLERLRRPLSQTAQRIVLRCLSWWRIQTSPCPMAAAGSIWRMWAPRTWVRWQHYWISPILRRSWCSCAIPTIPVMMNTVSCVPLPWQPQTDISDKAAIIRWRLCLCRMKLMFVAQFDRRNQLLRNP